MGGPGIAAHTLNRAKKSALKRGKVYAYDAMNLLYSMCYISDIADLLNQSPPVPTREIVGFELCFAHHLSKYAKTCAQSKENASDIVFLMLMHDLRNKKTR